MKPSRLGHLVLGESLGGQLEGLLCARAWPDYGRMGLVLGEQGIQRVRVQSGHCPAPWPTRRARPSHQVMRVQPLCQAAGGCLASCPPPSQGTAATPLRGLQMSPSLSH